MKHFVELVDKSALATFIIAIALTGCAVYLYSTGQDVPQELTNLLLVVYTALGIGKVPEIAQMLSGRKK